MAQRGSLYLSATRWIPKTSMKHYSKLNWLFIVVLMVGLSFSMTGCDGGDGDGGGGGGGTTGPTTPTYINMTGNWAITYTFLPESCQAGQVGKTYTGNLTISQNGSNISAVDNADGSIFTGTLNTATGSFSLDFKGDDVSVYIRGTTGGSSMEGSLVSTLRLDSGVTCTDNARLISSKH